MATFSRWLILIGLLCVMGGSSALAEEPDDRDRMYEDRIAELERTVGVLATELERTRRESVVPESPELKSKYGMGPAASKVFDCGTACASMTPWSLSRLTCGDMPW